MRAIKNNAEFAKSNNTNKWDRYWYVYCIYFFLSILNGTKGTITCNIVCKRIKNHWLNLWEFWYCLYRW